MIVKQNNSKTQIKSRTIIMAFYSPQGGTGKTTISFNIAVNYALKKLKVLFIDIGLFSSIDNYFYKKLPGKGINYLFSILRQDSSILNMDTSNSYIKDAVYNFLPDYLDVLIPDNPIAMDSVVFDEMEQLLDVIAASRLYDAVIVDMTSELSERNIATMVRAQYLMLVINPDVSAMHKLMSFKNNVASQIALNDAKIKVIANRCIRQASAVTDEIKDITGYEVIEKIPENYSEILSGINAGIPAAMNGGSDFNVHIKRIASKYLDVFSDCELKLKRRLFA